MISCRVVRKQLLEMVRQTASDASLLEVESHLQECEACTEEAARWKLVGAVKSYQGARLSPLAHQRILDHLTAAAAQGGIRAGTLDRRPARRRYGILVTALSVTAVAAAVIFLVAGPRNRRDTVADGEVLESKESGSISFGGARVTYRAGTRMTFRPATRGLTLSQGEVELDVTPGSPGRFRVTTSHFVVEVLGTRFVVSLDGVRTLHGRVRVLDLVEHELAIVEAGHAWTFVEPPSPAVTTVIAGGPLANPVPSTNAPVEVPLNVPSNALEVHASTSELLARSRAALARGDATQARGLAKKVLLSPARTAGDTAAAELLLAQALLVARHPDEAITAFRHVAHARRTTPEGDLAAFTIGQLLFERGSASEAEAAFNDYLARYPAGRFVREAREHLSDTRSSGR